MRLRSGKYRLLLGLLLLLLLVSEVGARLSVWSLRSRRQKTYWQERHLKQQLSRIKHQQRQLSEEIRGVDSKLVATEQSLASNQSRLRQAQARLAEAQTLLRGTEERLTQQHDALWERLILFYEQGLQGYLEVVLEAEDFADFVSRAMLVQALLRSDMDLLRALRAERARRAALQVEWEHQMEVLRVTQQRLQENRRMIRIQSARKRQILGHLNRDRVAYERSLVEIERTRREIESMLRRLAVSQRRRGGGSVTPWRGSLARPLSGRVTSGFGYRIHPIWGTCRFHDGIDIAAASGTLIRAAADGTVIYSGWKGAYGLTVMIDHGGGLTTLYGHCSSVLVSGGASVQRGQAIARVGSTGVSTGSHLHFSVYRDGDAVNPHTAH